MAPRPLTRSRSKAEHVAQQLLDRIISQGLKPASSMGTEADLLAQFQVSRPTLRESLRILESQGVLELRPGPGGGIIVRRPSAEVLSHMLSVYLRLHEAPFLDVVTAREVIEPALAAQAAQNGTEQDFLAMEQSIARMEAADGQGEFLEENRRFHSAVARAGGNKVLETFWSAISILGQGEHDGVRYTARNQAHVVAAHREILRCCKARDGRAAAAAMESHVSELERLVRKRDRSAPVESDGSR